MARLHVIAEGRTEERFVKSVLAPHLAPFGVFADARSVMTSRDGVRFFRGGLSGYDRAKRDILLWMRQERDHSDVWFTTMFDLYALPADFPGYAEAQGINDPFAKVAKLEASLSGDLGSALFCIGMAGRVRPGRQDGCLP